MQINLKITGKLLTAAFKEWWAKDPFKESAVIAFYAIFSMPGLLLVIITIAGYFFGADAVNNRLATQITSTMGSDISKQVQEMGRIASESKNSIWGTIIRIATILVGATGVFAQFQKSLNSIWEVKPDASGSGVWLLIRARLFSFGLIIAIAFIMMVSFIVNTILITMGDWLTGLFPDSILVIIKVINFIITFIIIAVLFAFMFKVFPDTKINWDHLWPGSVLTTLLFLLGMYGLSLYFRKADPASLYGAAGSIVLILLWVSYSSMIVFYGAVVTHSYALWKDGTLPPDKTPVEKQKRKA